MPLKTCFAMNYLMIHRLVEYRATLLQVVSEATYMEFENELFTRKNGPTLKFQAQRVLEDNHLESFWIECDNYFHIVKPIFNALWMFDRKSPTMLDSWLTLERRDSFQKRKVLRKVAGI